MIRDGFSIDVMSRDPHGPDTKVYGHLIDGNVQRVVRSTGWDISKEEGRRQRKDRVYVRRKTTRNRITCFLRFLVGTGGSNDERGVDRRVGRPDSVLILNVGVKVRNRSGNSVGRPWL